MQLVKSVIIEGFDNCGKSTLINQLSNMIGAKVYRAGGAPKSRLEYMTCLAEQFMAAQTTPQLMDRVTCISNPIYNTGLSDLEFDVASYVFGNMSNFCELVICRPPDSICLDFSSHEVKEYDSDEHIKFLQASGPTLLGAYDTLTSYLTEAGMELFVYDFTKQAPIDVINFLLKRRAICK